MYKLLKILFVTFLIALPYQLNAADMKDSKLLLCSLIKVIECELDDSCYEGTAEGFDLPQFVRIDLKKKIISTTKSSREKKESHIRNLERIKGKIFIQGVENGRAWSAIIEEDSGKMSATVAEERVGFIVFGACTSL